MRSFSYRSFKISNFFKNPEDRRILDLAIPALGSLAIDPLVSLVDTMFVGRLGAVPLAALGINAAIFSLSFIVFNFLAYGTTPRVSRALGQGDRAGAGRSVVVALTLAVLAGLVATTGLLAFSKPILLVMGAGGEMYEPALAYLRIRAFAGPAVLLITASHGAFRGFLDTRTPLWVALGMNLVNLVLDPLFIFVLGWGIAGAAWATVIAQWSAALVFVVLLLKVHREKFGIELKLPALREIVPFLQIGGHLLIRTGALVGTMTLATAVAARVGVTAVAAHQIAVQLWGFLALVVDALAVAGQTLVAHHLGAREEDRARAVGVRLLQWGVGLGLVLGAVFFVLGPLLPRMFTDDATTIQAVMGIFVLVAIMQPLNGLVFVWDGIYMGAGAFRYLAIAMVISASVSVAILLAVPRMGWGLTQVWWGLMALMGVRAVTLAIPWMRRTLF